MTEIKIRAVLFQEEGWWVAQCLDYDIAAQARTRDDLLTPSLLRSLCHQLGLPPEDFHLDPEED